MKIFEKLENKHRRMDAYPPATLGFLGDSITNGIFEIHPGRDENGNFTFADVCRQEEGYVAHLRKLLHTLYPRAQLNVINAGISGDNAPNAVGRMERDLLVYRPDLTVVCFGLNDVFSGMEGLEAYRTALDTVTKRLLEAGSDVILMTPPMAATYRHLLVPCPEFANLAEGYARFWKDGTFRAYMQAVRDTAEENGVMLCDCFAKWERMYRAGVDTTSLLCNHLNHPVRELHPVIAHSLLDVMLENA